MKIKWEEIWERKGSYFCVSFTYASSLPFESPEQAITNQFFFLTSPNNIIIVNIIILNYY